MLDQGEGIPPEKQDLIFERFWRPDPRTSNGAGLGLSIVKRIVEAHGGTVTVGNRAEGGAEFRLNLCAKGDERTGGGSVAIAHAAE